MSALRERNINKEKRASERRSLNFLIHNTTNHNHKLYANERSPATTGRRGCVVYPWLLVVVDAFSWLKPHSKQHWPSIESRPMRIVANSPRAREEPNEEWKAREEAMKQRTKNPPAILVRLIETLLLLLTYYLLITYYITHTHNYLEICICHIHLVVAATIGQINYL